MNSKRALVIVALVGLLIALSVGGAALAGNGYAMTRYVIGGGGGHAEAGDYVLDATVGQAVVGVASNGPRALCAGFWCGMGVYRVYLPLVMRSY